MSQSDQANYTLAQAFATVRVTPGQAAEVLQAMCANLSDPELIRTIQTAAGEVGLLPLDQPEIDPPARSHGATVTRSKD